MGFFVANDGVRRRLVIAYIKGIKASKTICFAQLAFEAFSFQGKKKVNKDPTAALGIMSLVDAMTTRPAASSNNSPSPAQRDPSQK